MVPSARVLSIWSMMLLVVPLAAGRLRRGESRADRYFFANCGLATFLLLAFVLRMTLRPALAALTTFASTGLVALVYVVLSPMAPSAIVRLVAVLGVVDAAALALLHLGAAMGLGELQFSLVLLVVAAAAGTAAVWVVERVGRRADAGPP